MAGFAAINGVFWGHQNVDFRVAGFQIVGLKSMNYKLEVSKKDVRGTSQIQMGVTPGSLSYSGDFELYATSATTLMTILGPLALPFNGLANLAVPVSVSYGPVLGAFPPFSTDTLPTVYITSVENSSSEGDEPVGMKFTMKIAAPIIRNGVPDMVDFGSIGAIG